MVRRMQARLSNPARFGAAAIALVGAGSLAAQPWVTAQVTGVAPLSVASLAVMSAFFTNLTALMCVLLFAAVALTGRRAAWATGMLAASMIVVALVYHLLLAELWDPRGIALWADRGLHTVLPAMVCGWWLWVPSRPLPWYAPLAWLIWPGLYAGLALGGGAVRGWYPYQFLDVAALGAGAVAGNMAALAGVFLLAGYGLWAIGRLSAQSDRPGSSSR